MNSRLLNLAGLAVLSVFALGCGSDSGGPTGSSSNPGNDLAAVNQYLAALPSWQSFSNLAEDTTAPDGDMFGEMSSNVLCTNAPYSITQNPDAIVTFGSAPDVLYLGSLIQGDSYLGGLGTMEELPIRQRAPLNIALKLFSGTDITRVVTDPDAASVQSALSDMVADAAASGIQSGSRISYNYEESYSSVQAALSLDVSYKYMGSSGRAALNFQKSDNSHTVTAFFKQVMFEAYIVRPQTPADFFSTEFTIEKLDEQKALGNIGDNNLPVYVNRIQYGRMLMYTMTVEGSKELLTAAVDASYNGLGSVDASIRGEVETVLKNSTVKVATIGGTADNALALLRSGNLKDYFATGDPITTAEPLAYAVSNLADGSLAQVSETSKYTVRECSEVNAEVYLNRTEWENAVRALAGDNLIHEFRTTAGNLALANERTTAPAPNENMGYILTFAPAATGWPFTFYLRSWQGGAHSGLIWDDSEWPVALERDRSISIGDIGDAEDDNFSLVVPQWNRNTAVFAIGISVGDNVVEGGEVVRVNGINSFTKTFPVSPSSNGTVGFIGVVSTVPLTELFFEEAYTDDDIFVRDPVFGVLQW